jgi:hypothetical protein
VTITEEFQKRQAEKPDKWTLSWWSKQFQEVLDSNRGLKHAHHLALAEIEDLGKQVKELRETLQLMASSADQDRAKIGEHQERLDRQGDFLTTLKKKETK